MQPLKNRAPIVGLFTCLLLWTALAAAQEPPIHLTEDLDLDDAFGFAIPTGRSLPLGDTLLFEGESSSGTELWRSDGTVAGTRLVTNLRPEFSGHEPIEFLSAGPTQAFLWLPIHGQGRSGDVMLWRTDGTHVGSRPLLRVPRQDDPQVAAFAAVDDRLLLTIESTSHVFPTELWVSDGTPSGSRRLSGPTPKELLSLGDRAVFFRPGAAGQRLFVSDGTVEGTVDLGSISGLVGAPRELTRLGEGFAFVESGSGDPIWVSDGTVEGTRHLDAFAEPAYLQNLKVVGDRLYGVAIKAPTSTLFVSDGTAQGTREAPELWPAGPGSKELFVAGSQLYLLVKDADASQNGLWRLDPQLLQHQRLTEGSAYGISARGELLTYSDGSGTFITDGTAEGTRQIPVNGLLPPLGRLGDTYLAYCLAGVEPTLYLCSADQELESASQLVKLSAERGSRPSNLHTWGDRLYLAAPYTNRYFFGAFYEFSSDVGLTRLLDSHGVYTEFAADDAYAFLHHPFDLAALSREGDLVGLDVDTPSLSMVGVLDDRFFYWDTDDKLELRSIAPGRPSELLLDVFPGGPPDDLYELTPALSRGSGFGDRLVFGALADAEGPALLRVTDGTPGGTKILKAFAMSPPEISAAANMPQDFVAADGYLYFTAVEAATGRELWRSDGTTAGTVQVADLTPGPGSSELRLLTAFGSGLAFVRDEAQGPELWLAAPGAAPRRLVKLGVDDHIHEMVTAAGRVYFTATTAALGRELWVSDGSAAGTEAFDLFPGPRGSGASSLAPLGDGIFFAADDEEEKGMEPWTSAGTRRSTRRLFDLYPGPKGSSPTQAVRSDHRVYFAADHPDVGHELFYLDLEELGSVSDCPQGSFCPQGGCFEVRFEWRTEDASGLANQVTSEGDSALYWFFTPDNWESMVKVLDGCGVNGHYWVFAATSSDVGYTLTVTDHDTGDVRIYTNPIGNAAPAITDSKAFATCS